MRKIGIIFILFLFGMSLWKASDREQPINSAPAASLTSAELIEAAPLKPIEQPLGSGNMEQDPPQQEDQTQPDPPGAREIAESNASAVKPRQKLKISIQSLITFDQIVIPTLKINASVVAKPYSELSWDLTTLGQDVALLGNIPNQTSVNNLILAGHVTVRNGSNGPFRYLSKLNPGDQVILQDDNFIYTYIVREQVLVYPDETSILEDSQTPQITLITCTTWNEETLSYLRRRVIVADLEGVESRQVLLD
ncbi:MAG: sortase [Anaerolineales bacterium]|nr:sortase [Anaerolineales bacterium]